MMENSKRKKSKKCMHGIWRRRVIRIFYFVLFVFVGGGMGKQDNVQKWYKEKQNPKQQTKNKKKMVMVNWIRVLNESRLRNFGDVSEHLSMRKLQERSREREKSYTRKQLNLCMWIGLWIYCSSNPRQK